MHRAKHAGPDACTEPSMQGQMQRLPQGSAHGHGAARLLIC